MSVNRTIVCGWSFLVVSFLAIAPALAVEFRAVHGVKNAAFQKWFNETASAGYRVTYLQGFQYDDTTLYAAVAIKDGQNLAFEVRNDISDGALKKFTDDFTALGYRVSCVSGYLVGDELKFAAIWTKGEKQGPWKAANKANSDEYQQLFNHFTGQQMMPTFLTGYLNDAGKPQLGAIFEKDTGEAWVARHDLTADDYQKVINEQSAKGLRPTTLTVYNDAGGRVRFAVVMKKDGVAWAARHNLTPEQYQQQFNAQAEKGFRPLCISAYEDGVELRYAAVWIKDPAPKAGGPENDGVIR